MITYDRLWETARAKGISMYALNVKYNISKAQLYRLRHNQVVSTNTIDRICNILECSVEDVMEHFPDSNTF